MKLTVKSKKEAKKAKKEVSRWKVIHYEYKPKRKLSKEIRELQECEEKERLDDRKNMRDIAMYFEGIKQAKGDILPFGLQHLNSLWRILKKY